MNNSITYLHNITPDQLKELISETIKTELEIFAKNISLREPEELLTRTETAELLKINLTTLWSWSKKGKLKSYGIGNRIYYKRSEIETALVEI